MIIQLISIGTQMPSWVKEGYNEYAKRLTQEIRLELVEIATKKRPKNVNTDTIQQFEERQLLAAAAKCDLVVALDAQGTLDTTAAFSKRLQQWQLERKHRIGILVGGPEGLTTRCIANSHLRLSLSKMTFPHPLVRVIIAEQIYRAWSLMKNHPYHR